MATGTSIPAPLSCASRCLPGGDNTETRLGVSDSDSCPGLKDRPEMGLKSRAEPPGPAWHQCHPLGATRSWDRQEGQEQNLREEQGGRPSSSRHSLFSVSPPSHSFCPLTHLQWLPLELPCVTRMPPLGISVQINATKRLKKREERGVGSATRTVRVTQSWLSVPLAQQLRGLLWWHLAVL